MEGGLSLIYWPAIWYTNPGEYIAVLTAANVNGNIASDGVYFFKYEIEGINGKVLAGHGDIQLIR